jgi:SAM-dependent methyltransferase
MYSQEELLRQCPKPEGEIGKYVGIKMNEKHPPLWEWGLSHVSINEDDHILDAGCGGGEAIKLLAKYSLTGLICGIDHSMEMVKLSLEITKELINTNRIQIYQASISKLPFSNNTFNLVTAFETYAFWPDILNDFKEVRRVMKPGGKFILVHSAYKHKLFDERNTYWSKLFNISIHSPDELKDVLSNAGFISVKTIEKVECNWLTVIANKE